MKRKSIIKSVATATVAFFILAGCGGGGSGVDSNGKKSSGDNWGIDHPGPQREITHGPLQKDGKYRCDIDKGDAIKINSGEKVRKLVDGTEIRIWHYQNSEEYVCLLKGKAVIDYSK